MAEYDLGYMQEHCIDVYFRHGGRPFHALTYGTTIPAALNDVDRNRRIQHQVAVDMEEVGNDPNVVINYDYVSAIINASILAAREYEGNENRIPEEGVILQMFKPAAQLGFFSYDCVEELEDGRGRYWLVAYPGVDMEIHPYDNIPDYEGLEVVDRDEESGMIISFIM